MGQGLPPSHCTLLSPSPTASQCQPFHFHFAALSRSNSVPASLCQHHCASISSASIPVPASLCQHPWLTCSSIRVTLSPPKPQAPQKQPLMPRVRSRDAGHAGKRAVLPWRVTKIFFSKMKACSSVKQTFHIIFLDTLSRILLEDRRGTLHSLPAGVGCFSPALPVSHHGCRPGTASRASRPPRCPETPPNTTERSQTSD